MDILDQKSRFAWVNRKKGGEDQRKAVDLMWYMWCGKKSPLFGRDRMTTFERCLIEDKSAHTEPKNAYYRHTADPGCLRPHPAGIRPGRGACPHHQRTHAGEDQGWRSPIHGGGKSSSRGRLQRAYQKTTGIAGYTLVYNAHGLKLISHEPFKSREDCVTRDDDILSKTEILESLPEPQKVADSDIGRELQTQIDGLQAAAGSLPERYHQGGKSPSLTLHFPGTGDTLTIKAGKTGSFGLPVRNGGFQ